MNIKNLVGPAYIYKRRDQIVPYFQYRASGLVRSVQRYLTIHGLPSTENDRKLAALKDKHKGRRCFVIGNGPSLQISDLDMLKDEITIASNKIFLAFDLTDWRPTYYTVADRLAAENNTVKINLLHHIKIFPSYLKPILENSKLKVDCKGFHLYFRSLNALFDKNGKYRPYFSPDALAGFHIGETVTNLNIQLAYYLGCNPIYIIGIDGTYQIPENSTDHPTYKKVLVSQGEVNHFSKEYRIPGEMWSIPKPEYHEIAYMCCRNFLEKHKVTILNASRRSFVKAFERIDLDSIL